MRVSLGSVVNRGCAPPCGAVTGIPWGLYKARMGRRHRGAPSGESSEHTLVLSALTASGCQRVLTSTRDVAETRGPCSARGAAASAIFSNHRGLLLTWAGILLLQHPTGCGPLGLWLAEAFEAILASRAPETLHPAICHLQ